MKGEADCRDLTSLCRPQTMHWSQTESSKCSLDCVPYPHVTCTWATPAYVKLYYNSVLLFKYLQL